MTLAPERPTRFVMNYVPRSRYEDKLTLAALLTAVGCARLLVRYDLAVWGISREHADIAELLVSELAANAVKATGISYPNPVYRDVYDDIKLIVVRLRLVERKLVIEVWDSSQEPPVLKAQDLDAESGRGLLIVQSLSSRWGYYHASQGGKVVWCELTVVA
jgi:anti-sigma regulatory factor (Ser/Thr protein kinase)